MKPDIPPLLFAPQPAALALGVAASDPLEVARAALLGPAGLDENRIAGVLGDVMGHAVDYTDIYFQLTREESWALEDGIVKDGAHSIEQGVGVRALAGEKTGFAYSDEVMLPALLEAAHAARAISRSGADGSVQAWRATGGRGLYSAVDPVETMTDDDKVRLLEQIDREARSLDSRITQVMASLAASHDIVLVMASDGTLAGDVRPLVRLNVSVIIEQDGRREQGYAGGGGRFAYTEFLASERWRALVKEAVRTAQVNLEAVPAPAGTMTVVLGAGWPGVLLHEAVGHGLEGDFNRKGTSAFSGRIGHAVARSISTTRARQRSAPR
jgi:TldD protein